MSPPSLHIAAASSYPMAALSSISLVNPPTTTSSVSMAALLPYQPGEPSHCYHFLPNGCYLLCQPSEPSHYCQFSPNGCSLLYRIGLVNPPYTILWTEVLSFSTRTNTQHEWLQKKE